VLHQWRGTLMITNRRSFTVINVGERWYYSCLLILSAVSQAAMG